MEMERGLAKLKHELEKVGALEMVMARAREMEMEMGIFGAERLHLFF